MLNKQEILEKAIKRLENDYISYVSRLEKDKKELENFTGDEYDFKNRKQMIEETEKVIVVIQSEIAKYKEDLKNLIYVKGMDDKCFG